MHTSPFLRLLPFAASFVLAGACAEGAALDDADDDSPTLRDPDASAEDARARSDASGSSSSSGGSSSSSGSGGSSSGAGVDGGSSSGGSSGAPSACALALAQITLDFEDVSGANTWYTRPLDGFSNDDDRWPFNPWYISQLSTQVQAPVCPSGRCAGTELTANYVQCQRGEFISPKLDLSACEDSNVVMVFEHAYDFKDHGDGTRDGALIEIAGDAADPSGGTYSQLGASEMPGTINIRGAAFGESCLSSNSFYVDDKKGYVGAHAMSVDELPVPAAKLTANARLRFLMSSGVAADTTDPDVSRQSTRFGWRIDNIRFEERP